MSIASISLSQSSTLEETSRISRVKDFFFLEVASRVKVISRAVILLLGSFFISIKGILNFSVSLVSLNSLKDFTPDISITAAGKDLLVAEAFFLIGGKSFFEGILTPEKFMETNTVDIQDFTKGVARWIVFRPYSDIDVATLYR